MNPYDVLGVPGDADAKAIKRAFRRRARETHPDRKGNREEFEKVVRASVVLSDPAKRSKYDSTGTVDEDAVDNTLAKAVSAVVGFLASLVERHVNGGPDPSSLNVVKEAKVFFERQLKEFETRRPPILKAKEALERVESRLAGKGPRTALLKQALRQQAASTAHPLAQIEQEIALRKAILDLLATCTFDAEKGAR